MCYCLFSVEGEGDYEILFDMASRKRVMTVTATLAGKSFCKRSLLIHILKILYTSEPDSKWFVDL